MVGGGGLAVSARFLSRQPYLTEGGEGGVASYVKGLAGPAE